MQRENRRKIIMIMLDGFGIPPEGWNDSVFARYCSPEFVRLFRDYSIPLDAVLGVDGLPQSATGQTSLFCGCNAQAALGRHLHAFPGETLCAMIRARNIFKSVLAAGRRPTVANAYLRHDVHELAASRFRSVTTVMTAAELRQARTLSELKQGLAVFHDITNASAPQEAAVPIVTPARAAANLLALAADFDFTLFEYFLTDRAGHQGDREPLAAVLRDLDGFITALVRELPPDTVLLVSSDHGNCEDLTSSQHSCNPVPLLLYPPVTNLPPVTAIDQVHDLIMTLLE